MFLSDMQSKDIVSMKDGRKIGHIIDAEINNEGNIVYLVVEPRKSIRKIFGSSSETKISFKDITKIGEDVILVNMWYNVIRGGTCE